MHSTTCPAPWQTGRWKNIEKPRFWSVANAKEWENARGKCKSGDSSYRHVWNSLRHGWNPLKPWNVKIWSTYPTSFRSWSMKFVKDLGLSLSSSDHQVASTWLVDMLLRENIPSFNASECAASPPASKNETQKDTYSGHVSTSEQTFQNKTSA